MTKLTNEQIVVASIIKVPSLIDEYLIKDSIYIKDIHKNISNVVARMYDSNEFVSANTLKAKFGREVSDYIQFLSEQDIDMREFNAILQIQKKYSFDNKLSSAINGLSRMINDDSTDIQDKQAMALDMVSSAIEDDSESSDEGFFSFSSGLNDYINTLHEEVVLPSTGISLLDEYAAGMYDPGEVGIIAGQSGSGKTALTQLMISSAARKDYKSIFLSMEMPKMQVVQRFLSSIANVKHDNIKKKRLTRQDIQSIKSIDKEVESKLEKNIFFSENNVNVEDIRRIIKKGKRKMGGVDLIFIDFLDLLGTYKNIQDPVQEIVHKVKELKKIAKEVGVAIILLAQVNRDSAKGSNKRPQLTHLKGSSIIENLASVVVFIHREEVYNSDPNMPLKGLVEFNIKKNRHGENNKLIIAKEDLAYSRFIDIPENEQEQYTKKVYEYISKLK